MDLSIKKILIIVAFTLLAGCGGGGSGTETGTGTATLSWTAPATRADGSALAISEISGYKVYKGTDSSQLTLHKIISGAHTTECTITGLSSGIHYFSISTISTGQQESEHSEIVSKSI